MLKKTLSITASAVLLSITAGAALLSAKTIAGVPVVDVGAIFQAKLNIEESQKRLKEMKTQVQAQTGNAKLGGLVNDPITKANLNKYMPKGTDINKAVANGDLGALQGMYNQVKANEASFDGKGKERLAATLLVNQAQINGLLATIDTRNAKIENIMQQINNTTDLASKADLANALAAEQALVNAEMNRMAVLMKQADINAQAAERQAAAEFKKKLINNGSSNW